MMKTFKKVGSRVAVFIIILSMMITSQITISFAGPVDFNNPVFNFNKILFVKKEYIRTTDHGSGGHFCDQNFGFNAVSGGGLYILNNPFSGTKSVTDVLANSTVTNGRFQGQHLPAGAYQGPDLSYDGNTILFAFTQANKTVGRTWDETTTWHIFKVNVDGTNLTQLTDGVYNDFDPCWTPEGKIIFISERRGGYGRCHGRTVPDYNPTEMNADGSNIRVISYHETNEFTPSIDNNGMLIYTRWDYVHRGECQVHAPWISMPDGLDPRPVSLNYMYDRKAPMNIAHLKPIPGSNKYVGVACAHHGQNYGAIVLVDPDVEDDDSCSTIKKVVGGGYPETDTCGDSNGDQYYSTPWALSEDFFLCVYNPTPNTQGVNKHYSLYAVDSSGNLSLLYDDPAFSVHEPIPVRARTKPNAIQVSSYSPTLTDGIVSLMNVNDSLFPFPGGTTITQLRILQVYVKTTPYANNPPVAYSINKNTVGVLGTVPVETDGSAAFYLPQGKPVYFQALNSNGLATQTMRSDMYLAQGQSRVTCQGCHEPRHLAADIPTTVPLALRNNRTPSTITADTTAGARPMSYPRLIQPTLDAKCISCHTGGTRIDLRKGTQSSGWFVSYNSLASYVYKFPDAYWDYGRSKPGQHGALASSLYTYLTNGTHNSLTTAAEKHAFILWMDSGTAPFYGEYNNTASQEAGNQVEPLMD